MIPLKLTLHNFMSYKNPTPLDFSSFDLACLCGENGSGKSTILEAITFALWGKARGNPDALIHHGQQGMWIDFEFEKDEKKYRVIRKRSKKGRGTSELDFLVNREGWETLAGATIKETEEKIDEVLKLPYEIFVNSAYLRQGHADEFTEKPPSQRKEILGKILDLDFYELLSQKAREKVRRFEAEEDALLTSLFEIQETLKQKEIFEKELKEAEKDLKAKEENLKIEEKKLTVLKEAKSQFDLKSQKLETKEEQLLNLEEEGRALKTELGDLKQELKEIKELLLKSKEVEEGFKKLSKLEQENEKYNEKLSFFSKYQEKLGAIKAKEEEINQKIARIQKIATCPTCLRPLSKSEAEKIIKELLAKLKKEVTVPLVEIEHKIKEIGYNKIEHQKIKQEIVRLAHFEEEKNRLNLAKRAEEDKNKLIKKTEESLDKKRNDYIKVFQEKKSLEKEIEKLKSKQEDYLQQERKVEEFREQLLQARGTYGAFKQRVEDLEKQQKIFEVRRKKLEEIKQETGVYKQLSEIFSKKGLQAMIIETVLPEIEEEANKILDKITDGKMKVAFLTSREKKSGEGEIETLEIKITDPFGERDYEMYSIEENEPVYIREKREIKSVPIKELWNEGAIVKKRNNYQFQPANYEALCYERGKATWKKLKEIFRHPAPSKLYKVVCNPGNYNITLTAGHSIFVITPEGLKTKRSDELKPGDFVLSPKTLPKTKYITSLDLLEFINPTFAKGRRGAYKKFKYDNHLWFRKDQKLNRFVKNNKELAEFLGLAVAEGSGNKAFSIATGSDRSLASKVIKLSNKLFGTRVNSLVYYPKESMARYTKNAPGISSATPKEQYRPFVGGGLLSHIITTMVGRGANQKHIPDFILNAPHDIQLSFLKGLVKGDGHLKVNPRDSKSEISITTVSKKLVADLIFMCRQLGIWARLESHGKEGFRRGMHHRESYRVVISGRKNLTQLLDFSNIVTDYDGATKYEGIPYSLLKMIHAGKEKRLKRNALNLYHPCSIRIVPLRHQKQYKYITNFLRDWNVLEITKIQKIKPKGKYVYDLVVPRNHSFVAGTGAILVHNSGGEAFRIDLAIRVALSKVLSKRAGTKLQFLAIDEGLGSLDQAGKDEVVDAVTGLKEDFKKILVVTHIQELKNLFPTRVEVYKDNEGSHLEVVSV